MLSRNSLRALRGLRLHPLYSIRASAATIPASTTTATNPPTSICAQSSFVTQVCSFSSTPLHRKGLRPESQDPTPPNPEPSNANGNSTHAAEATPMSDDQYREYSEHYLNTLLGQLENLQESGSDIEAEYSAGVLNVNVPGIGVYVINKQPPNKQIWLSSPISGPRRYDWVIRGDGMNEKEGTREYTGGQWIYLRDGSNLTTLVNDELGLEMDYDIHKQEE